MFRGAHSEEDSSSGLPLLPIRALIPSGFHFIGMGVGAGQEHSNQLNSPLSPSLALQHLEIWGQCSGRLPYNSGMTQPRLSPPSVLLQKDF